MHIGLRHFHPTRPDPNRGSTRPVSIPVFMWVCDRSECSSRHCGTLPWRAMCERTTVLYCIRSRTTSHSRWRLASESVMWSERRRMVRVLRHFEHANSRYIMGASKGTDEPCCNVQEWLQSAHQVGRNIHIFIHSFIHWKGTWMHQVFCIYKILSAWRAAFKKSQNHDIFRLFPEKPHESNFSNFWR